MNNMQISYRSVDEKSAREFLAWQYEPPYDIYNCPPEQVEEAVRYNTDPVNHVFAMFNPQGELVGYCSYGADARVRGGDYSENALDIGLVLNPAWTGQGHGADFAQEVISRGVENYAPQKLRVTIAAFNHRAIRVWEKNGFRQTQTFKRSGDGLEFIIMTRNVEF